MQPAVHRYTQTPFPPYRYLPTVNPHPGIHPEGHSFGRPELTVKFSPPQEWKKNQAYLYGVDLYNHGFWWEAHEYWEAVWMTTPKLDIYGQFLQSLIQYSAALLKLYGENLQGFKKLYGEAKKRMDFCRENLAKTQRHFMGLDLVLWPESFENFKSTAVAKGTTPQDPLLFTNFPWIVLEV